MTIGKTADPAVRADELRQENAQLLNELESVYREAEGLLLAVDNERVAAYRELKERNRDLENRLEELNAAHEELGQAQKMLVRSERMAAMGEMASSIVHEIRNPLHVIGGHVELLMSRMEHGQAGNLAEIAKALGRLQGLTENVLRFSRKQSKHKSDIDLNAIVDQLLTFMTPVLKTVTVRLAFGRDIPPVHADVSQVEQVLMNLLLNAQEALDGTGEVVLETGSETIEQAMSRECRAGRICTLAVEQGAEAMTTEFVFVEVRDSGPGIPADLLPKIFQPFVTSKSEGTGLGLSISRTIVENWGGNILAASNPGQGAGFRVFLPMISAES